MTSLRLASSFGSEGRRANWFAHPLIELLLSETMRVLCYSTVEGGWGARNQQQKKLLLFREVKYSVALVLSNSFNDQPVRNANAIPTVISRV